MLMCLNQRIRFVDLKNEADDMCFPGDSRFSAREFLTLNVFRPDKFRTLNLFQPADLCISIISKLMIPIDYYFPRWLVSK